MAHRSAVRRTPFAGFRIGSIAESGATHVETNNQTSAADDGDLSLVKLLQKVNENLELGVVFLFYASIAMCIFRELADQTNLLLVR